MSERERVDLETGFVLHQRPYRNTSQLLECTTESHGRIGLIARGSRRADRGQRGLLQPFVRLRLSWVRRGDLGRLVHAEADRVYTLGGERLLAGFYLNELLLRLTARGDANPPVFSCYSRCLAELAGPGSVARTVRLFELRFLHALGYGLALDCDAETGEPIHPEHRYLFELERGPRAVKGNAPEGETFRGHDLISLRDEALHDEESLLAAKRLLGRALAVYLGERPLKSRIVLKDIVERGLQR